MKFNTKEICEKGKEFCRNHNEKCFPYLCKGCPLEHHLMCINTQGTLLLSQARDVDFHAFMKAFYEMVKIIGGADE